MSSQQLVDFQISREHVHSHVDEANHTELKLINTCGMVSEGRDALDLRITFSAYQVLHIFFSSSLS